MPPNLEQSTLRVEQALQGQLEASNEAGVATEFLQPNLNVPIVLQSAEYEPGTIIKLVTRRPACIILVLWSIAALFALLLAAVGELKLSTSEALFITSGDVDVQRNSLIKHLPPTDALHDRSWMYKVSEPPLVTNSASLGRRLQLALPPLVPSLPVSSPVAPPVAPPQPVPPPPPTNCPANRHDALMSIRFELVYEARDGGSMLRPRELQEVLVIEQHLRAWADSARVCAVDLTSRCACRPFDSISNYIFPSVESAGLPNATLTLDALGLNTGAAQAGVSCGVAIDRGQLTSVLDWLSWGDASREIANQRSNQSLLDGFVSGGTQSAAASSARYLRTGIILDLQRWYEIAGTADRRGTSDVLGLTDTLDAVSSNAHVRIYSDFVQRWWTIRNLQVERWLWHDGLLLLLAILLIWAYMAIFFRSAGFAFLAVMQIVLSFPLMFFVVDVVLAQRPVSAFACCSLWIVTGVSADNIFVVYETWQQAARLRVDGQPVSLERRVQWTLLESARPLLIADSTTAFALFINCISPIPAIFQFGMCGGVLIFCNFALVMLHMPALLVLAERGRGRFGRACCHQLSCASTMPTEPGASKDLTGSSSPAAAPSTAAASRPPALTQAQVEAEWARAEGTSCGRPDALSGVNDSHGGPSTPPAATSPGASKSLVGVRIDGEGRNGNGGGGPRVTPSERRAHALHTCIFECRKSLALVVGLVVLVLLPAAVQLTGNREGHSFEFFQESSDPPPSGIQWKGQGYQYNLSTLGASKMHGNSHPLHHQASMDDHVLPWMYENLLTLGSSLVFFTPTTLLPMWPYAAFLGLLLLLDAAILGAYAVVCLTAKRIGPLRQPTCLQRRTLVKQRYAASAILALIAATHLGLASWFFVLSGHTYEAMLELGCHVSQGISWVLFAGLVVHAFAFALLAAVYAVRKLSQLYFSELAASSHRRVKRATFYASLSILCLALAVVVAWEVLRRRSGDSSGGGGGRGSSGGDGDGGGSSRGAHEEWRASGSLIWLWLVWLYWSGGALAAHRQLRSGHPPGYAVAPFELLAMPILALEGAWVVLSGVPCCGTAPLSSLPPAKTRALTSRLLLLSAILLHLLSWLWFALGGFEQIISPAATSTFLGVSLLITSLAHMSCARAVGRARAGEAVVVAAARAATPVSWAVWLVHVAAAVGTLVPALIHLRVLSSWASGEKPPPLYRQQTLRTSACAAMPMRQPPSLATISGLTPYRHLPGQVMAFVSRCSS